MESEMRSKYIDEMLSISVGEGCEVKLAPITVSLSDSVTSIVKKMIMENVGAVVVVEGDKPVGVVTERDLLEKIIGPKREMNLTLASDVMSKPVISIESNRPMKEAMELMRKHNIRRVVVTKEGAFFGLLTERRFLEAAFLVV
jgi:CBS domain-containing protein